jgi:hypothetical protein
MLVRADANDLQQDHGGPNYTGGGKTLLSGGALLYCHPFEFVIPRGL